MKKLMLTLLAAFAFLALGAADPAPTVTISMLGCNPAWADDGSLVACPVQAIFQTAVVVADQKLTGQQSISWDGTDQKKTVVYNGNTYTYYEATMVIAAIANQERASQAAAATVAAAAAAKASP